ncbi:MAG: DUF721 domain-containing protein [Planctomycetales bacterium]|nr:DUF721 domain-containing protein [Planctomycetales bacterium]
MTAGAATPAPREGRRRGEPAAPGPLAPLVRAALRRVPRRSAALERLAAAFAEAAGPDVARGTRVRGRRAGVLHVEVESPALLYELRGFRGEEILRRWPADAPPVARLRVRLAAGPPPGSGGPGTPRGGRRS